MKNFQTKFPVHNLSKKYRAIFFVLSSILLCGDLSSAAVQTPELKQTEILDLKQAAQPSEEQKIKTDRQQAEAASKDLAGLKEKSLGEARPKETLQRAFQEYLIPGLHYKGIERILAETGEQNTASEPLAASGVPQEDNALSKVLFGDPLKESQEGQTAKKKESKGGTSGNLLSSKPLPAADPTSNFPKSKEEEKKEEAALFESRAGFPQNIYKVWRVYDGDSLRLEGDKRVVLIGVDAPENFFNRKMFHESRRTKQTIASLMAAGRKAVKRTKQLAQGKWVRLEFDAERQDRFGRLLAYAYLQDGTFLNAELIRSGYARAADPGLNMKFRDYFLDLEREARQNRRGFWKK